MPNVEITKEIATKVRDTVDAGLIGGVGNPIPGQMCVEAAVCYALGLPHGDDPICVSTALRSFKIKLNDCNWSTPQARAKGMRRLALIQLGSAGHLDDKEFSRRLAELAIRIAVPAALRSAASVQKDPTHKAALLAHAVRCECEGTRKVALEAKTAAYAAAHAANAAYAAANAAYAANAANAAYAAAHAAYAAANAAYAAYAAANAAYAAAHAAAHAAANAANAAYAAAHANPADMYAARDKSLSDFAEAVVQLLIDMKAPGTQWLYLAPLAVQS